MDNVNILNSLPLFKILIVIFIIVAIYHIYQAVKKLNDIIKQDRFRDGLQVGSKCTYLNTEKTVDGVITKIEDDVITVEIKTTKESLYTEGHKKNTFDT